MDPAREQTKEEEVTIRGQRRLIAESGQTEPSGSGVQGGPRLSRLLQTAQSELESVTQETDSRMAASGSASPGSLLFASGLNTQVNLLSRSIVQSFLTLCDPPWTVASAGSSVHGILQAKILECVALSSSRGSS